MDSVLDSPSNRLKPEPHQKSLKSFASNSKQALLAELILLRVPQLGPATYWQLREKFGSAENILNANLHEVENGLRQPTLDCLLEIQKSNQHVLVDQCEKELIEYEKDNIEIIVYDDDRYPNLLKTIHNPPPILFVQGNVNNLFLPQLAIVGSRNPSPTGTDNAQRFAQKLSAMGFVITSGMALGIDAAAHQGALKQNCLNKYDDVKGSTIAVVGTGIDKVYPRSHRKLRDQILENDGAIVTEFPLGIGPHASHFPRRNRIISGMSLGVLVVEAAIKSGSLITARQALQQNREVFAIPGSIHNPLSRGCHALLREGAVLVESIDDMRDPLSGLLAFKWAEAERKIESKVSNDNFKGLSDRHLGPDEKVVLKCVDHDLCDIDKLEQRTGLPTGPLLSALMALELEGLIEQHSGSYQLSAKIPS